MKKSIVFFVVIWTSFLASANEATSFRSLFLSISTNSLEFGLGEESVQEWGLENGSWTRNPEQSGIMLAAISAMSNHVEAAVSMIPEVVTNGIQRELFLHMAGYAGTNAFLCIWDGCLNICETNPVSCPPSIIEGFWNAPTTPLEHYSIFYHNLPICQSLLTRTRDLFPTNAPNYSFFGEVLSGAKETELRDYLIGSGEGLPWFAQ